MKKAFLLLAMAGVLAACGSSSGGGTLAGKKITSSKVTTSGDKITSGTVGIGADGNPTVTDSAGKTRTETFVFTVKTA